MLRKLLTYLAIAALGLCVIASAKTNVLLIMADDLGYSDLGCYGGEIETPVLDSLAESGVRFSSFYNTAKCHSTRVSLLSGRYEFQAGSKSLSKSVIIPEVLKQAGYRTLMSGKWHLDKQPTDFGFDRYFGHLSGATNYFSGNGTFRLNGQKWRVPEEGFYTTVAKVDYAIDFLEESRKENPDSPWFLYVAFNAPHAPLQPLKEDYEKYLGKYNAGWEKMNKDRFEKIIEKGVFPEGTKVSPRPDHIPDWNDLIPEIRDWEGRRMAAIAGLIDRMDKEIGRLVENIKANGEFDDTLILFISDNGACPYDRGNRNMDGMPYKASTSWSDSTGWAWSRNTPFRFYKQNQFEGGVATPAVLSWPNGLKHKSGSVIAEPVHVVDVLPTLADISNVTPQATWPNRNVTPIAGISFLPLLQKENFERKDPIFFKFGTDRGLRDGKWKLVSFKGGPWELYDLEQDRTELVNLSTTYPDKMEAMADRWIYLAESKYHVNNPSKGIRKVSGQDVPKVHSDWSNYSGENGVNTSSRVGKDSKKKKKKKNQ